MGGALPHTDNWIRQAARGRGKSDCWKTTCESQIALLALDLSRLLAWTSLEHLLSRARNFAGTSSLAACSRYYPELWPRNRLNQPSSRRRRIEGTTSKNSELNAYRRKESFLWRHAAASTSIVFSTREHPKKPEPPTWPPRTKTRATHSKETKLHPACFNNESKYL